jgi:cell division protein FtsN
MDSGARNDGDLGNFFPERAVDEAAARLLAALTTGTGHVLVSGAHAADVDTVLAKVDAQLTCHRRLRLSGVGLDPEAVVSTLGADLASADPPPSAVAILTTLAAQARASEAPIVIVIGQAEEAGVVALEQLCALLDQVPDARDTVRLVALGGPTLGRMLTHPAARQLSVRFSTIIQAPPCERAVLETSAPPVRERRMRRWAAAAGIALALGTVGMLAGSVRHWNVSDVGPVATPVVAPEPATHAPSPPPAVAPPSEVASVPMPPPTPRQIAGPAPVVASPAPVAASPAPVAAVAPPAPTPRPAPATTREPTPPPPAPPTRVVSSPAAPAPAPAAPSGPVLQLGAFRSPENAESLREQVARLYPDAHVSNAMVKGVEYHRVRVGAHNARDLEARAAALRAAGFATVRVRN